MSSSSRPQAALCLIAALGAACAAVAACEDPSAPTEGVCVVGSMQVGAMTIEAGANSTPCPPGVGPMVPDATTASSSGDAEIDANTPEEAVDGEADGGIGEGATGDGVAASPGDAATGTDAMEGADAMQASDAMASDAMLGDAMAAGDATETPDAASPDATSPGADAMATSDATMAGPDAAVVTTITAGASNLWFLAQAYAPPGTWQINVTAQGALALGPPGPDGGAPAAFSQTFTSTGASGVNSILVPVTSYSTEQGAATITTSLGALTQQFFFTVVSATPVPPPTCIRATDVQLLAWASLPPPPPPPAYGCAPDSGEAEDGACPEPDSGPMIPTLIVDIRLTLVACSTDAGVAAGTVVTVQGTGGLEPVAPTFTTDHSGTGAFELRGAALLDYATAVLSSGPASTTVCVSPDASCPDAQ